MTEKTGLKSFRDETIEVLPISKALKRSHCHISFFPSIFSLTFFRFNKCVNKLRVCSTGVWKVTHLKEQWMFLFKIRTTQWGTKGLKLFKKRTVTFYITQDKCYIVAAVPLAICPVVEISSRPVFWDDQKVYGATNFGRNKKLLARGKNSAENHVKNRK